MVSTDTLEQSGLSGSPKADPDWLERTHFGSPLIVTPGVNSGISEMAGSSPAMTNQETRFNPIRTGQAVRLPFFA